MSPGCRAHGAASWPPHGRWWFRRNSVRAPEPLHLPLPSPAVYGPAGRWRLHLYEREATMSRTTKTEPVDVLIVGAGGASGATVAKVLTEAGLRVVGLERGPWLKPDHFSGDEIKFINRNYLWPDPLLVPRTVRRNEDSPAQLQQFSPLPQMVGGGTIHYSGWFPRATESDFRMRSLHGNVDGASLADWPFSYDDLEPYYTKVEWEFGVSGVAGANKYEARRSAGYPCPPPPLSRYGKVFYDTCTKLGYNAF